MTFERLYCQVHGCVTSLPGVLRLLRIWPWRRVKHLLVMRWRAFRGRRVSWWLGRFECGKAQPIELQEPWQLIEYWTFFVRRDTQSPLWIKPFSAQAAPLVLDIGANIGMWSWMASQFNPRARFIAYEPFTAAREKLEAWQGQINLEIRPVLVGSQSVFVFAYQTRVGLTIDWNLSTSLDPVPQKMIRLDDEGLIPYLVKIDVDGCEWEVIQGGLETLAKAQFVIIELMNSKPRFQITRQLMSMGFASPRRVGPEDYLFAHE